MRFWGKEAAFAELADVVIMTEEEKAVCVDNISKDNIPEEEDEKEKTEINVSSKSNIHVESCKDRETDTSTFNGESKFLQEDFSGEQSAQKIAEKRDEKQTTSVLTSFSDRYECVEYESAVVPVTPITTAVYITKDAVGLIEEKIALILNKEAPISFGRLLKKTLRGFDIGRASEQTIEATEKVLKKMGMKPNRQNGMKFFWREDQSPENYKLYRIDVNVEDKRLPEDISQQEIKNAVCRTLQEKEALAKDDLIRETIRTMGYSRSGVALTEAVERGLKYGRKTGEIVQTDKRKFMLANTFGHYGFDKEELKTVKLDITTKYNCRERKLYD